MMRIPSLSILTIFGLIFLVGTCAALLPDFTREELIIQSEEVVLGTVENVTCSWTQDHSSIYTYVTLKVEKQFKGQTVGTNFVIQIPGGTVDDIIQVVSDTPEIEIGMRIIVHTFMQETGYPWIYGWEKGVLLVENDFIPDYGMTVSEFSQLVRTTME